MINTNLTIMLLIVVCFMSLLVVSIMIYTDVPNNPLPVVNVYDKLLYVDRCRYDLHIPEELRQL